MKKIKLHLGCGTVRLDSYINIDLRNHNNKTTDIIASCDDLPFEPGTVDEIISFHLFEHFEETDANNLLRYWHSLLKVGGKLIIECPNLYTLAKRMIDRYEKENILYPGYVFGTHSKIGRENIPNDTHKWGYTPESLSIYLQNNGYRVIFAGEGTDYHAEQSVKNATVRVEAIKI